MKDITLEMKHNIEYEMKLIDLLGYNLIGPDNSNRWLIVDDSNNQVGFIQYKKLFNKNVKKGYPKTFGYHTIIDSSDISYSSTRKINNTGDNSSDDINFSYEFDVKRENKDIDHIEINMNEFPSLTLWSKKYGFINFHIDYEKLCLNFKSETENFNIEEVLIFKSNGENNDNYNKEYTFQIRYCKKGLELSNNKSKRVTTREISGIYSPHYHQLDQLKVLERTWINGKLRVDRENTVIGTVEEMVVKHQMGIDAFNHFRFLINHILPFKQDVISLMLTDGIVKERGLSLFIFDLEKEKQKTNFKRK